jgi:hypothetical protein
LSPDQLAHRILRWFLPRIHGPIVGIGDVTYLAPAPLA